MLEHRQHDRDNSRMLFTLPSIKYKHLRRALIFIVLMFAFSWSIWLEAAEMKQSDVLIVGTIERPPFAMKDESGNWEGYSIDLFRAVAEESGLTYELREVTQFSDMIDGVKSKEFDLAAANISITSEREAYLDFSQPIYDSGFQIIVSSNTTSPSILRAIWQTNIVWLVGLAFIILLIVAHLMWYFERGMPKDQHDYFRDDYRGGIFDAFWWAFIIVTIGGFENERPENTMGRILAIFWIVASLFFVSTFTAQITTTLTVAQLQSNIETVDDLRGRRVGSVPGTVFADYLDNNRINYIPYDDFSLVLADVSAGKLEAAIGDAPVVQYYVTQDKTGSVLLTGDVFEADRFAFAISDNHPNLEQINLALIDLMKDGTMEQIRTRYFGD